MLEDPQLTSVLTKEISRDRVSFDNELYTLHAHLQ